jgi:hypothetical protein
MNALVAAGLGAVNPLTQSHEATKMGALGGAAAFFFRRLK